MSLLLQYSVKCLINGDYLKILFVCLFVLCFVQAGGGLLMSLQHMAW